MAGATRGSGDLAQDINVLPLIDVLLVLLIVFFVMARGLSFIPVQVPAPEILPKPDAGGQILLELKADGSFAINGQPIPAEQLDTQLHSILDHRTTKLLFIEAADGRPYQNVISAMDLARGAGVQLLGWVPRRPPSR